MQQAATRSSRNSSQPDKEAVWAVAERIAAEVDAVLAETGSRDDVAAEPKRRPVFVLQPHAGRRS